MFSLVEPSPKQTSPFFVFEGKPVRPGDKLTHLLFSSIVLSFLVLLLSMVTLYCSVSKVRLLFVAVVVSRERG
jgi:hypothetical protein